MSKAGGEGAEAAAGPGASKKENSSAVTAASVSTTSTVSEASIPQHQQTTTKVPSPDPPVPPTNEKTPPAVLTNEKTPPAVLTNKKISAEASTPALLSPSSLAEMLPPTFTNGLAWWGRDASYGVRTGGVWAHGGCMQGVRTHVYLWPARRVSVVVLTNGEGSYRRAIAAVCDVLDIPSDHLC